MSAAMPIIVTSTMGFNTCSGIDVAAPAPIAAPTTMGIMIGTSAGRSTVVCPRSAATPERLCVMTPKRYVPFAM